MWDYGVGLAVAAALASSSPAPEPPGPREPVIRPCIVPVTGALHPCPDGDLRPPVSCVLPVTGPGLRGSIVPDCPDPLPVPEGRTVPLTR